ncbi:hypothetical protein [Pseudalkalibacillus decolorationis]|uniref:hypothetical protein n=1 Tax=Pseudalkalibacillus decolorationis TaxID=163879 RepID=UPI00214871E6|nr:hypothetical protein [Pseudalkalibacillus decolorationis]
MEKYIILTNKETYQTTVKSDGLQPVESYDFYFFDKVKATYTIAQVLDDNVKIHLYENYEGKEFINDIRVKFFESFGSIEAAQEELNEMVKASGSGPESKYSKLVQAEAPVQVR